MTSAQAEALRELRRIAAHRDGVVELLGYREEPEGALWITISVGCGQFDRVPGGLPLRQREDFDIYLPATYPYGYPYIYATHTRFREFDHVQWAKHLCMYAAPNVEWSPQDGMYGFMDRLELWLKMGAANQLQPTGEPLHPPVAYGIGKSERSIVARANAPTFEGAFWIGFAKLQVHGDKRADIVDWYELGDEKPGDLLAPAILLSGKMPFEYPRTFSELYFVLQQMGVEEKLIKRLLGLSAWINGEDAQLFVVLGSPMRGISGDPASLRQHLAVWQVAHENAKTLALLVRTKAKAQKLDEGDYKAEFEALIEQVDADISKEMGEAKIAWCDVLEGRPEVTVPRDEGRPASWLRGKRIAILGCGALGCPTAEIALRARASTIHLFDNKNVTPGVLVRQLYQDSDVGKPKASALADRLRGVYPEADIVGFNGNIINTLLVEEDPLAKYDLVIDCTASNAVATKIESRRDRWKTKTEIVSMLVDSRVERGVAATISKEHTGGIRDVYRMMRLEACNRLGLDDFLAAFWPAETTGKQFQPEPGCSEPTFAGSLADALQLASTMLNLCIGDMVSGDPAITAVGHYVRAGQTVTAGQLSQVSVGFARDVFVSDPIGASAEDGYTVRISPFAWRDMQAWIRRRRRMEGPDVETGGILYGTWDSVSRIIWVTEIGGPPPDSTASEIGFDCGILGVKEENDEKQKRTQGVVSFVGLWHTHPNDQADVSDKDLHALAKLVALDTESLPRTRHLTIIVGVGNDGPEIGAHVVTVDDTDNLESGSKDISFNVNSETAALQLGEDRVSKIGLTLSGGGSRAIAFHLGCLRGLYDLGLLGKVTVLSTVSGGSVIGALYRYRDCDFVTFDLSVQKLLRQGLIDRVLRKLLNPINGIPVLLTIVTSGVLAAATTIFRTVASFACRVARVPRRSRPDWIDKLQPPLRRFRSRTDFMIKVFSDIFWNRMLADDSPNEPRILINSCEMRTGAAFRFSNTDSFCWRYGKLRTPVSLGEAVAASAAYPAALPAVDRDYEFETKTGDTSRHRVILTDGGVDDNLGLTALEPGRNPDFGYAEKLNYLICCDAGQGLPDGIEIPYWWPSRMIRAVNVVMKSVQDGAFKRLFSYLESGQLDGFALVYLGQQDKALPVQPPDLVKREQVSYYPTDFGRMSQVDINLLTTRGEQLVRLLVARYMQNV